MKLIDEKIKKFISTNLSTTDYELIPIKKGGSDRNFFRVLLPDKTSFIFMHYGTEVEENSCWAGINRFLTGLEISVPQIVAQDIKLHFILLTDLGDVDLWSHRALPWDRRRDYYFQALTQIRRLHAYPLVSIPADLKLSESYGPRLYKWEHDYFLENLVREVCKLKLAPSLLKDLGKELDALIAGLQKIESCLIHRDFQSQNIMIKNGKPVLIDFQGMRQGCLFYDLGSLICDSYVTFTAEERDELISFYYEFMKSAYSRDEFENHYWEASAQRLMQALGAYGFLGLKKNKPAFLKHIDNGLANLLIAVNHAPGLARLKDLAIQCRTALVSKKY
jgi:aminoglycoside/choline kinase family phosphotransferase